QAGSGDEDDLADVVTRFHHRVGLGRLFQGEGRVDDGLDLARFQKRPDMLAQLAGNGCLEGNGTGAQGGAGNGQTTTHDVRGVNLTLGATQQGNDDDAAVIR